MRGPAGGSTGTGVSHAGARWAGLGRRAVQRDEGSLSGAVHRRGSRGGVSLPLGTTRSVVTMTSSLTGQGDFIVAVQGHAW